MLAGVQKQLHTLKNTLSSVLQDSNARIVISPSNEILTGACIGSGTFFGSCFLIVESKKKKKRNFFLGISAVNPSLLLKIVQVHVT